MEYNAFDGGVLPGGLRNINDIRLLICYILKNIEKPLTKDTIITAIQENGLANYFELADAFSELVRNGHLKQQENGDYTLTSSGKMIVNQLAMDLPLSVKEKAVFAIMELLETQRSERENTVTIKKVNNGSVVNCIVPGEETNLLELELYVPDSSYAANVKKNFHKNPELIYKSIVAVLTGNNDILESALEDLHQKRLKK